MSDAQIDTTTIVRDRVLDLSLPISRLHDAVERLRLLSDTARALAFDVEKQLTALTHHTAELFQLTDNGLDD